MEQEPQYPHQIRPTEVLATHRHWLIIFIVSLIFVMGAASWGMLLFDVNPFGKVPSIVSTEDQFKDWKTYRNNEYGFEFKYPNDWEVQPGDAPENLIVSFGVGPSKNFRPLTLIMVDKEGQPFVREREFDSDILERKEIIIDGVTAESILYQSYTKQSLPHYTVIFSKNGVNFLIDASEGAEEKSLEVFNQILSTFKFTEPATTMMIDTADWKTYRNEEYGFEFKYPEEKLLYPPLETYETQSRVNDKIYPGIKFSGFSSGCSLVIFKTNKDSTLNPFDESGIPSKEAQYAASEKLDSSESSYHLGMSAVSHAVSPEACKAMLDQIISTFKFAN